MNVDLIFEKGDRLSLIGISGMLQDLSESFGYSVDLVSRNSLEREFAEEVLLYEK